MIAPYGHDHADTAARHDRAELREGRMKLSQIAVSSDPYAPFRLSQECRAGDLLFVSGRGPTDESGHIVGSDFDGEAPQVFKNLERVLRAGDRVWAA